MTPIEIFLETGRRKTFAGAVAWPGWCRSGRDEVAAVQAMLDYGPRYAQVVGGRGVEFRLPAESSDPLVAERHTGNATTDFGAPAIVLDADREPLDAVELQRLRTLLRACWQAFDDAVERAAGRELRKGLRGGGRELDKIVDHVIEADHAYLGRLARKRRREPRLDPSKELEAMRGDVESALDVAVREGLPERGPRGGVIWPPRYFVRRVAWHVLDHAWEIEDRSDAG